MTYISDSTFFRLGFSFRLGLSPSVNAFASLFNSFISRELIFSAVSLASLPLLLELGKPLIKQGRLDLDLVLRIFHHRFWSTFTVRGRL